MKHSILNARNEMDQTFIIVSHDMDFVKEICDRVAWMKGGKVVAMGSAAEVLGTMPSEDRGGIQTVHDQPTPAL